MNDFINILICDDNKDFVKCISNYISENEKRARVSCITFDGKEAIEKIKKTIPDIVLLDLNMPQISGNDVLEELSKLEIAIPRVIIVTGIQFNPRVLMKYDFVCGIIVKGKSYKELLNQIRYFIQSTSNEIIKNRIKVELSQIGFKISNKSTKYLIDVILIALHNANTDANVIKKFFLEIENKYNMKYSDIISSIQKSIEFIWINSNQKELSRYFYLPEDTKPTVKVLIEYFIEKYKEEIETLLKL